MCTDTAKMSSRRAVASWSGISPHRPRRRRHAVSNAAAAAAATGGDVIDDGMDDDGITYFSIPTDIKPRDEWLLTSVSC